MIRPSWKFNTAITTRLILHKYIMRYAHKAFISSDKKCYYITTPIFYVNSKPHLGHLYTAVIADAAQRFQKLLNSSSSYMLSAGTDEHGLKIQQASSLAGEIPLEFCDRISSEFKKMFDLSLIKYSDFIRTTEMRHKNTVNAFFNSLHSNGVIYKGKYEGWYCVADEAFLTEKQIKKDLLNGNFVVTSLESGHPVEWCSEENYVFRLSNFQDDLLYWLKEERIVPSRFQEELKGWILKGLHDLSISRPKSRVSWGLPLPCDDNHTIYVWLDALVNYLTVAGYPNNSYWPPNLQVIGKDILRFHGIYWPALLMAAGLEPPQKILVHSHWKVDGVKMSKSIGNVICPFNLLDKFSTDGLRYLLLRLGTPHSDTSWNNAKAVECVNAELANTLGNLINRCTPISLNPEGIFPPVNDIFLASPSSSCQLLIKQLAELPDIVKYNYNNHNYYLGIEVIMSMLRTANVFIDEEKPWEYKNNTERAHLNSILSIGLTAAKVAGIALQPIIPTLSNNLLDFLGIPTNDRAWCNLETVFIKNVPPTKLKERKTLFKRIVM